MIERSNDETAFVRPTPYMGMLSHKGHVVGKVLGQVYIALPPPHI